MPNTTTGDYVMLKSGFGYWDVTVYPIGGEFHRVGSLPLLVTLTGPIGDYGKGCNAKGTTVKNRTICFNISHAILVDKPDKPQHDRALIAGPEGDL